VTPDALPHALAEWIAGWQDHDADRSAAVYAQDAVHEIVATGQTLEGPEAMRANIDALMAAIPDGTLTVNQALAAGDVGVIDWSFAGHYTNPHPLFPAPSGQALTVRAAILFELADGLVVRSSEFYDVYGLLVQLGVLPPLQGAASDEATPAP
jgi:steroid delta-isomerase-like uncharacterized protein